MRSHREKVAANLYLLPPDGLCGLRLHLTRRPWWLWGTSSISWAIGLSEKPTKKWRVGREIRDAQGSVFGLLRGLAMKMKGGNNS